VPRDRIILVDRKGNANPFDDQALQGGAIGKWSISTVERLLVEAFGTLSDQVMVIREGGLAIEKASYLAPQC
jgi:hypothetical protein